MKVKCVDDSYIEDCLTAGNLYDVIKEAESTYELVDDKGNVDYYYKSRFKVVYEGGVKYDSGKLRMELIPPEAIEALAKVITYGANKYSDDNWKKVSKDRYIGALMRHLNAYRKGELYDDESGLTHMAHILTNAAFLVYKEENDGE